MFEVRYVYHDCFLVTTPECALVFDFWKDPTIMRNVSSEIENTRSDINESVDSGVVPDFIKVISKDKPLYVFVSHFHKDHFNRDIFRWEEVHDNIRFIISKDTAQHARHLLRQDSIYRGPRPDPNRVTILRKGETYSDAVLSVKAFGSTDTGNSYAVTICESGLKIFHAGDLNCWTWRDESTQEEIAQAENAFEMELDPIAREFPAFDIVMFPVDSRIGTGYAEGAHRFLKSINVGHFFPMHFELADSEEELMERKMDASDLRQYSEGEGEIIALTASGDRFRSNISSGSESESGDLSPVLSSEFFLSAGEANAEQEMSVPLLTSKLIDIATEHANHLHIGNPYMPNDHCGWVLSRLTIEMKRYPRVDTCYRISTWVESWNRHFSERAFRIDDSDGNNLGYARSVWMVLDTKTRANAGLTALDIDERFISPLPSPDMKRQAKHLAIVSQEESASATGKFLIADREVNLHTFLYSDLDAYRHVNTVRYVQLLMNQFSLKEHDENFVERLELSFLHEGEYGKEIEILRAVQPSEDKDIIENALLLRRESDKTPILFSRIRLKHR